MSVGIAYTGRRENHGTMIFQGVSYSAYYFGMSHTVGIK